MAMRMRAPSRILSTTISWLLCLGPAVTPGAGAAHSAPRYEYDSVLAKMPDRVHGQTLFGNCAHCHGGTAGGSADGTIPALAGQHFRVIARQLVDFRYDKRWDARMEHFADTPYVIATQDVADIADYISSLNRTGPTVSGDGEQVTHGGHVYALHCANCHGPVAEGNNFKAYPRLAGQHYPYLLEQLHDAVEGRRPNFPISHIRLLEGYDRDDLVGLSDFLSRISVLPSTAMTMSSPGISTNVRR
jgi:cytochrome c553